MLTILMGVVIGVLVGMAGTGGAFIVPALVQFSRMDQVKAQGTALAIAALPVWIGPLLPYAKSGHVAWTTAFLIGAGVLVGGYFGAQIVQGLPQLLVRRFFATVLVLIGVRMFFR